MESAGDPRIGTQQHYAWLHGIVSSVLILNLVDAILTLFWVWMGVATEANDLLASFVDHHPVAFVAIKLGLVSMGTWLLWSHRSRPLAVLGIFAAFMAYYWILAIHADYVGILLRVHLFS